MNLIRHRILVVDDNPAIHEDFRKIFGAPSPNRKGLEEMEASLFGHGGFGSAALRFEIDCASQGREGLDMVLKAMSESRPYSVAFVDVRMPPGWDGIETIHHLWEVCSELQVVICTAYSDYTWEDITVKLGPSDRLLVLKKPFDNIEVQQLAIALATKWTLARQAKTRMADLDHLVRERTEALNHANEQLRRENNERRQIEAALRLSEERFSKAFQSSPVALAIYSPTARRFTDINQRFSLITGFPRVDLLDDSQPCPPVFMDMPAMHEIIAKTARAGSLESQSCKLLCRNGSVRDALVSMERIELAGESHVLLQVQDITDRLRLEEQLRYSQKMDAVGKLAAGIAHDFNNILTVVQGHADLLLDNAGLDLAERDALLEIASSVERGASLTRQLLAFSRNQVLQSRPLDLNQLFERLSGMLRRIIGEDIRLVCEFEPSLPAVQADTGCLEQVLINLALNARDAMAGGGTLTLRTESVVFDSVSAAQTHPDARSGHFVRVSVADTGVGMSPEVMGRIFEPFFTTKEFGKGTGLGLATVYGIIKQHDGWLEVQSSQGKGSTFSLFLPAAREASSIQEESPKKTERQKTLGGETILLVEDEESVRHLTETVLKKAGYEVLCASNGQEALKIWNQNHLAIDMLVTDMVMPEGLSGKSLAQILRAREPRLKVIFMSGYSMDWLDDELLHSKDTSFIAKPHRPEEMLEKIHVVLHGGAAH